MSAASQKKSLAGLDSTQTDAIASLEEITGILGKNGNRDDQIALSDLSYFLEYATRSGVWGGEG